jgi:hypothetical protein
MTKGSSAVPDVRPPNPPWLPIQRGDTNLATITFYYGDAKSQVVPIRDVTNKNDAKPDPNVETLTYGLFSVCCKDERKAIVEKGIPLQFFCTSRANSIRVLTGYYRLSWYCQLGEGDYAIAAQSARFVSPGFALNMLTSFFEDYPIQKFFRTWKYIDDQRAIQRLLLLIDSAPDATDQYISEIHRLEKDAMEQYGHMYFDRSEGFSWEAAAKMMKARGLI